MRNRTLGWLVIPLAPWGLIRYHLVFCQLKPRATSARLHQLCIQPVTCARNVQCARSGKTPGIVCGYRFPSDESRTATQATKAIWEIGDAADDVGADEPQPDPRLTLLTVAGTALLGVGALAAADRFQLPNLGFGANAELSAASVGVGALAVLPMLAVGEFLRRMEDDIPDIAATANVTKALSLQIFGPRRQPVLAVASGLVLGLVAGLSEELLFRGVMQTSLDATLGSAGAIFASSFIFGLLHAATPLYAVIAGFFSAFFGVLFTTTGNLIVPISTHAIYDVVSFVSTHWLVTALPRSERLALLSSVTNGETGKLITTDDTP